MTNRVENPGTWASADTASRSTRSIRAQYSLRMVLQQEAQVLMAMSVSTLLQHSGCRAGRDWACTADATWRVLTCMCWVVGTFWRRWGHPPALPLPAPARPRQFQCTERDPGAMATVDGTINRLAQGVVVPSWRRALLLAAGQQGTNNITGSAAPQGRRACRGRWRTARWPSAPEPCPAPRFDPQNDASCRRWQCGRLQAKHLAE